MRDRLVAYRVTGLPGAQYDTHLSTQLNHCQGGAALEVQPVQVHGRHSPLAIDMLGRTFGIFGCASQLANVSIHIELETK